MAPNWGADKKQQALVADYTRYKQGDPAYNPPGPDGRPLPLKGVTLRVASDGSGREVMTWTVQPDTDPVQLVQQVLERADRHADDYTVGGVAPTYVIEPLFGTEKTPAVRHGEDTYQPKAAQGGDPTRAFGGIDLRRPENRDSVALQTMGAMAIRAQELMVQGFGGILVAMDKLNDRIDKRAQALEIRVDTMRTQWEQAQDMAVDRQIKLAKGMNIAKLQGAVAEQAINALPAAVRGLQGKLAAWGGVEDVPFDERFAKIVGKVFGNPEIAGKIMTEAGLDESEQQMLLYALQEAKARTERAVSDAKIHAVKGGVGRPLPLDQFRRVAQKKAAG